MRKKVVFLLASTLCLSAQAAQWQQFTPTAYLLVPAEDKKVMALASLRGDTISVSLLDASGTLCGRSETNDFSPAGPYKVNGTSVRFIQICLNGNRAIAPETPQGKEFFTKAITSGPATVELDMGVSLHFNSESFDAAKKAMLETRSAL